MTVPKSSMSIMRNNIRRYEMIIAGLCLALAVLGFAVICRGLEK